MFCLEHLHDVLFHVRGMPLDASVCAFLKGIFCEDVCVVFRHMCVIHLILFSLRIFYISPWFSHSIDLVGFHLMYLSQHFNEDTKEFGICIV